MITVAFSKEHTIFCYYFWIFGMILIPVHGIDLVYESPSLRERIRTLIEEAQDEPPLPTEEPSSGVSLCLFPPAQELDAPWLTS